jgi:hypothetical protein
VHNPLRVARAGNRSITPPQYDAANELIGLLLIIDPDDHRRRPSHFVQRESMILRQV